MADKSVKSGDLNIQSVNAEDVVNRNDRNVDVRYSNRLTQVVKADEIKDYETKKWPMLTEDEDDLTNALGYPLGAWYERQQELKREQQKQQQLLAAQKSEAERLEREQQEQEQQQRLTVENLEKIRQQAYEEGHAEGFTKGQEEGYQAGASDGEQAGFEKGHAEGFDKGYQEGLIKGQEEGFAKGHSEGLHNGESIIVEQVERFRHLADSLANPLREVDSDVTDELIYILSRLCKVILKREITGDAQFIKTSIEQALSIIPNAKQGAEISLNPDDLALIEASLGREYIQQQGYLLQPDEKLNLGDVRVVNQATLVNWRIDDRIDALLNEFLIKGKSAVDKALQEHIDGAPEYDALPKKPLAPPPDFSTIFSQDQELNLSDPAAVDPQEPTTSDEAEAIAALQEAAAVEQA